MTDEQIIEALDIKDGNEELQQRMVTNTRHVVEMRVIGVITEMMSDEQLNEFQQLDDSGDSTAIWHWLRTNVVGVDVSEVYEAALQDYIVEFKSRLRQT